MDGNIFCKYIDVADKNDFESAFSHIFFNIKRREHVDNSHVEVFYAFASDWNTDKKYNTSKNWMVQKSAIAKNGKSRVCRVKPAFKGVQHLMFR